MSPFAGPKIILCPTGRRTYGTEEAAARDLAYVGQLPPAPGRDHAPRSLYQCPKCGWYHLTGRTHE